MVIKTEKKIGDNRDGSEKIKKGTENYIVCAGYPKQAVNLAESMMSQRGDIDAWRIDTVKEMNIHGIIEEESAE